MILPTAPANSGQSVTTVVANSKVVRPLLCTWGLFPVVPRCSPFSPTIFSTSLLCFGSGHKDRVAHLVILELKALLRMNTRLEEPVLSDGRRCVLAQLIGPFL